MFLRHYGVQELGPVNKAVAVFVNVPELKVKVGFSRVNAAVIEE